MSAPIRISPSDPTPAFEQLRGQIADAIALGQLPPGTKLPTVRQLAADLGLAPGTVSRAFQALEAEGLVRTRRGAGTVVTENAQPPANDHLISLAEEYVSAARQAGATSAAITAAVARVLNRSTPAG